MLKARHPVASQIKVGALRLLALLAKSAPEQLAAELPNIVPAVSVCMYDAKQQVKVSEMGALARSTCSASAHHQQRQRQCMYQR